MEEFNLGKKVFISYSWQPETNIEWVGKLVTRLRDMGIQVLTDADKDPAMDMQAFVVQMLNDPSIDAIVVVCNQSYKQMADGEIPIEGPVIDAKTYAINYDNRFIPIVREEGPFHEIYMPDFLLGYWQEIFFENGTFENDFKALVYDILEIDENYYYPFPIEIHKQKRRESIFPSLVTLFLIITPAIFIIKFWLSKLNDTPHAKMVKLEDYEPFPKEAHNTNWYSFGPKVALIKENGKVEPKAIFDAADNFIDTIARVKNNGKWGYVSRQGNILTPCKYDAVATGFSEGEAAVNMGDQWGFVNKKGEEIIAPQYEACKEFGQGLAPVKKEGKWGYVDTKNKLIIPAVYDDAVPFAHGKAAVTQGADMFYINLKGKKLGDVKR